MKSLMLIQAVDHIGIGACIFVFTLVIVIGLTGLFQAVFEHGFKSGLFKLAAIGFGLGFLWLVGALASGI